MKPGVHNMDGVDNCTKRDKGSIKNAKKANDNHLNNVKAGMILPKWQKVNNF